MSIHKLYINMLSFIIFIKFLLIRISYHKVKVFVWGVHFISRIFMHVWPWSASKVVSVPYQIEDKAGLHQALHWSYSGIRICENFVANLLYRDYWAACTLHILGYFIWSRFLANAKQRAPKRVIFRLYLFYSYFGIGSIKHVSHRVLFTHRLTIFNIPVFIKTHGLTDNVMSQVVKACFLRTERRLVDIVM